jgi:hypothetical protein
MKLMKTSPRKIILHLEQRTLNEEKFTTKAIYLYTHSASRVSSRACNLELLAK